MELTRNFEPRTAEEKWTKHWRAGKFFSSRPDDRRPYTIVIPPPNVTGVLHMGHTLNETVQDILIRKARMSGFNACWVPGSDHASIATEAKVVQQLEKEKGIRKSEISREEFLRHAYDWKEKYGSIIYQQIEKLGCSVDWDRVTFTMDDHYYKAVIKVFVDLYKKGLIYRGARMINWDPEAKTALSDEEVEYREVQGKLYYVKYMVKNPGSKSSKQKNEDHIVIATQRPETIMGDTGVAVNPNDDRYARFHGKTVIVPLVNREVPLIVDEYVDPEFGTGALKVTPAHDVNDYNLGLRHGLEIIDTLNEDGTLSDAAEVFIGLDRFEARKKAIEKLRSDGLLIKEEDYITRLGFSQRTNAVVEPRISTQWFVSMRHFADKALDAVQSGRVKIHPEERFIATYKYWLENIKDWCISRQLWWGQRIPAWYAPNGSFAVAESREDAYAQLINEWSLNRDVTGSLTSDEPFAIDEIRQDEDVLDTWFSSWLWPIEVFEGITNPGNPDITYYYPTSVLVTGQDIIFFWVARMIMAGMEYMNEEPFRNVYFTGMVRDKLGRKMSKQLGNSPDLLDLIDRYGADAVRFGIMISSPAGNDLLFDESSLEQGRNFNNKIWNALRLVKIWEERVGVNGAPAFAGDGASSEETSGQVAGSSEEGDHFAITWFEHRLNEARKQVEDLYCEFRLSEALKTIYSLIWDDFCNWFLEWVKPAPNEPVSFHVVNKSIEFFEELLQLLHPFMPFISEEIYHQIRARAEDDCLTIRQVTAIKAQDKGVLERGLVLKNAITTIRDARNKNQIKPKDVINISIDAVSHQLYSSIQSILLKQVNAGKITHTNKPIPGSIAAVIGKDKFYIETENKIDVANQKDQLTKDLEYLRGFLSSVEKKLNNERFVQNARPEVVEIEKKKKADAEAKIRAIEQSLADL